MGKQDFARYELKMRFAHIYHIAWISYMYRSGTRSSLIWFRILFNSITMIIMSVTWKSAGTIPFTSMSCVFEWDSMRFPLFQVCRESNVSRKTSYSEYCGYVSIHPDISRMLHCVLHMMTSSNGNIFRVTGPLCGEFTGPGEFPTQRPVARSFDVFFDLRLNKRLSKQPWGWWFETPSWSLWRQCIDKMCSKCRLVTDHKSVHISVTGRPKYQQLFYSFTCLTACRQGIREKIH